VDNNTSVVNPSSVANILTLRYDPTIETNLPIKTSNDFESNIETVDIESIENSISNYMKEKLKNLAERKICIALSGGVDSTLTLSLLRKIEPDINIQAVSVKFADSVDETTDATKIAETFGAEHHIIELDNYLSELPKAISIIKMPFWDIHWYYVVKKSHSLSKILISGDGGDELFGGYTFRYQKFLSLTTETSSPLEKIIAYLECHERDRVPDQEKLFGKKSKFSWETIYETLRPYFENRLSRLEQVFLADYNGKLLYNFNPINNSIINNFDMQLLTPILNSHLLSSAPHIKKSEKYDESKNIGKLPLRQILKQNGHDNLVGRKKLGFNVNTINLWKSRGQSICKDFLLDAKIVKDGWINQDWILKYIDNSELDIKYINKFLGILAFEIWYRLFITKEMNENTLLD
jgi:asparagine synthase (glutamine-hydrolysing)|tara:strand:+ start:622 stop:1842 length:1221 start_codon:yes stop_codon:yes gene_type:complete